MTAVLTIPYGIAFLAHERPVTGGHALAGLVIAGLGIFLLATIGTLSTRPSRSNAIALLVFQILTTAAAMVALLMQQLPFTSTTFLVLVAFSIPVLGSLRRFRPEAWTPKPVTNRTLVVDLIVEVIMVAGALALMVGLHSYPIGLILFVVGGIVSIWMTAWTLRMSRRFARLGDERIAG